MALARIIPLDSFQTQDLLKLESRAPGTYRVRTRVQGNSLLSTLYVKNVGAGGTVKVNYFETTTGNLETPTLERKDLPSHPLQSAHSADPNRITVTPFHNTPELEAIVTGDNVEFGVRVTVVSTFASDLDAALQFDQTPFNAATQKGLPMMCVNESDNELEMLRCVDGGLPVNPDLGTEFFDDGSETTVPGGNVQLSTFVVPALTTRKFNTVSVSSFATGVFSLTAGGVIIATGRTMPGNPNINFVFTPKRSIAAGSTVSLDFAQVAGENACPVQHHLMALDLT